MLAAEHMADIIENTDCLVLSVKPQMLSTVCMELGPLIADQKPLVLSIAAGIRAASISRWLGDEHAIVRCMPNTPAMIQAGASALFANDFANESQESFKVSTGLKVR